MLLQKYYVFFFQAEDGIRDIGVTRVQTCALPILRSSAYEMPDASKSFAYTLVAVNPGIVLSSFTTTSPLGRTKKSTRAIPSQSAATKAATASSCTRRAASSEIRARSEEHTSELQS